MLPLAVDLDGTLIRGDVFTTAILRFCTEHPWNAVVFAAWLAEGRPNAKAKLAQRYPLNAEALPYNEDLLDWLREQHALGRTLVLATAADRADAEAVATHLGLFSRVFASDGRRNLKSRAKAQALREAFPAGFVYAGNETADLKVWRAAKAAVVAYAPAWLETRVAQEFEVERIFRRSGR
ncbi:MAG: hypothetical protein JNK94_08715 [Hyphomonadaceae bacterium]|nr:hypothetical protein [Hyphomonadaceae bacterium]MBX3509858.1 hypothetical protein [Hyphomonadaceae bacterium]